MPKLVATNDKYFATAAEMVTSLALVLLMALALSSKLQAQGPALTTISELASAGGEAELYRRTLSDGVH